MLIDDRSPVNPEDEVALEDNLDQAAVVVLGGDSIVGRTLEALLWSADLSVRFLSEPFLDTPEVLGGTRLLLVAPGVGADMREAFVKLVGDGIPILELVTDDREEGSSVLHWPCSLDDLRERIQAALLAGPAADGGGRQTA